MGGQACILYGAAEFSRDVDFAVLASESNLQRLRSALAELQAEPVYFPILDQQALLRGHACHFRSQSGSARGLRIDIMTVMRGCDPFEILWKRRRRLTLPGVGPINVLALPDLVKAKKTQRDKDWPMLRRLVEVHYHRRRGKIDLATILFWLQEARTVALLIELGERYPQVARRLVAQRPAIAYALQGDAAKINEALRAEEDLIRIADHAYWQPLRAELFEMRRRRS
jgi:hypothetical protein